MEGGAVVVEDPGEGQLAGAGAAAGALVGLDDGHRQPGLGEADRAREPVRPAARVRGARGALGQCDVVRRLDHVAILVRSTEEALRFYEEHLGGRVTSMQRHEELPFPGNTPPEWGKKILHARIALGGMELMGADIPNAERMRSAYLSLSLDSEQEAERIYALLSDGGEVFMKMAQTPFANRFAMLRDRFGTSWMLLHQPESA